MHGIIHTELKGFVTSVMGIDGWRQVASIAGVGETEYVSRQSYPDGDVVAIVDAASVLSGEPVPTLLRAFGTYLAPTLLSVYRPYVKSQWRTLDLIEHTEATMHKAVRLRDPGAAPPMLNVQRVSANEVLVDYHSTRRLCQVAEGIASGVAVHYGETIEVSQSECMLRGDARCAISVKAVATSTA